MKEGVKHFSYKTQLMQKVKLTICRLIV